MNVLVIGAGIFGCSIAEELAKHKYDVTIIDRESSILNRASKSNHNRLHLGFHYPRSKETAIQSVNGLISFMMTYRDAIVSDFPNYYAIAKEGSKVSPEDFNIFCNEVGLFYTEEFPSSEFVNPDFISHSLRVNEPIFDFNIIKETTERRISAFSNIQLKLNTPFDKSMCDEYDFVINAAYEGINEIHSAFGLKPIELKLQDVLIPVLEIDHERLGLTIMDGPFGSIMPKGFEENRFLLYHVVDSVLEQSYNGHLNLDAIVDLEKFVRNSTNMYPILKEAKVVDSLRTVRALPINKDDARVSELFFFDDRPNFLSVLSGKIATCRKLAMEIFIYIETGELRNNIQS